MAYEYVISFKPIHNTSHQTFEEQRPAMRLLNQYMIQDGEPVPHHFIPDVIDNHMIDRRSLRSMTDLAGEGIVPAVDAICIYGAAAFCKQMANALMHGIE